MNSDNHELIKQAIESYNNCTGGKCSSYGTFNLRELECFAAQALQHVHRNEWEDALRWAKRCVEMEKKIGFKNAPIWGEFGETIERICGEISQSDST